MLKALLYVDNWKKIGQLNITKNEKQKDTTDHKQELNQLWETLQLQGQLGKTWKYALDRPLGATILWNKTKQNTPCDSIIDM